VPWYLLVALSVVLGFAPSPRWTIAVVPVSCLALGGIVELRRPENYDMPGLAVAMGVLVAAVCVVGWSSARLLSKHWRAR
jgi:drug/metabolite transporter (DMT)-like permease